MPKGIRTLHPRVAATLALIPLTWGLLSLIPLVGRLLPRGGFGMPDFGGLEYAFPVIPAATIYGGLLLIWSPAVRWTPDRVRKTAAMGVGYALLMLLAIAGDWFILGWCEIAVPASMLGGALVIILLHRVWWLGPDDARLGRESPCPKCGYDLQGQRECRCPECGFESTLGEMVQAMRNSDRDMAE